MQMEHLKCDISGHNLFKRFKKITKKPEKLHAQIYTFLHVLRAPFVLFGLFVKITIENFNTLIIPYYL